MCCFCFHFSDFNVFVKKIKNVLPFTFEKNNLLCKKRKENNLPQRKNLMPPWITTGPSLIALIPEKSLITWLTLQDHHNYGFIS